MGEYVEINGISTWFQDRGSGDPVVLLHGGLVDGRDFDTNLAELDSDHRVLVPDRRAHGRSHDDGGPLDLDTLGADAATFIQTVVGAPVALVAYSAGAMVALRAAVRRPDLVDRLVLISGAFDPAGMLVRPSLDGLPPGPLVDAYAQVSPYGADHFDSVLRRIVHSVDHDAPLTEAEVSSIRCPTLVMCGDDDLVTLEHTLALYRALPDSRLAVVPGTSHLLLHEKPEVCRAVVADFLTTPDVTTFMPIRRAGGSS